MVERPRRRASRSPPRTSPTSPPWAPCRPRCSCRSSPTPTSRCEWAVDLARGIASLAEQAGAPVVGGDLSSAPPGCRRRLGHRAGRPARPRAGAALGSPARRRRRGLRHARVVRGRAGALRARRARPRPGAGAGCRCAGRRRRALGERSLAVRALMRHHRAPVPPWRAGPRRGGRRGARPRSTSPTGWSPTSAGSRRRAGCGSTSTGAVLRARYAAGPLALALGDAEALHQVLAGGEEHSLVGVFADEASLPEPGRGRRARRAVAGDRPGAARRGRRHPGHRRRRGAGRPRLGPLRRLTGIRARYPASRIMQGRSGQHRNRSGAMVKLPGSGEKVVAQGRGRQQSGRLPVMGSRPLSGASGGQRLTLPALRQEVQTLSRFGVTPASPTSA